MLIINTESETLSRTRMIYLYINGQRVDSLKSNQVKQYNLKPGKYEIAARLNMYVTEPKVIEIKANGHTAFELTLKNNWKFLVGAMAIIIIGALINYFLVQAYSGMVGNIFILTYFTAAFIINSKINRKGYLELKDINYK